MSIARAAMAYAATHLLASARPSSTPMTGMATQNAQRARHMPVQSAAKSV